MPRPTITDRRRRILDEARDLLLSGGFKAMTMTTLARRVGISTGALYLEFESKSTLVEELLRHGTKTMAHEVAERLSRGEHDPTRLSDVYLVGSEVLLADPFYTAAFLDPDGVLGDVVASLHQERYKRRHYGLRDYLKKLSEAGRLAPGIDLDGLALTMSSYTIGLLTAARTLGPLTADDLKSSLNTMADLIRALERDNPADPGIHEAYSELLDELREENPGARD
ncbi:TetR/AcrR family transcriptional regulator [Dietzia sp. PP-33]|jgi:AcrR family transcriptional regulator|nr:TetR/AcrR family transcriptional regulator [Dietzia sp. PP-33]